MSERDKWGRIPAVLLEQDQPFCALNWGELPCGAGPQSNHQIYSAAFGDPVLWTTSGTIDGVVPFGDTSRFGANNVVRLDVSGAEFIFVETDERPLLPVLTTTRIVYGSFVFDEVSAATTVAVRLTFTDSVSGAVNSVGFDFNPSDESTSGVDPEVNDITFSDTDNFQWRRVTFWVDSADFYSDGTAYNVYIEMRAIAGSGNIRIGLPQISLDALTEYRQTQAAPIIANDEPCFNTVSSCQALETYIVEGFHDGLDMSFNGANEFSYTANFQGFRDEGLYLEFYLGVVLEAGSDFAKHVLVDVDGLLTASIERVAGTTNVVFDAPGASLPYPLTGGNNTAYRVAAYVSRAGTLRVRGLEGQAQGTPFSSVPQEITITGPEASNGTYRLSDLLVYDYEAKRIQLDTPRRDLVQKGDLTGDALFYAKYNRASGTDSESGLEASPPAEAEDRIRPSAGDSSGLVSNPDDPISVFGVTGDVDLLEPPLTLRYTLRGKSSRLPETLRAIPSLASNPTNKPAQLAVGGTNENISALGSRDELNIDWIDHPYSDFLVDPYRDQRSYNPEEQGTYWGKWLARNVYKEGMPVRYVSGYELANGGFERTHVYNYVLEKINGPSSGGRVTGKCFDILQQLQADKAVYPQASTGRLAADIGTGATSMTLEPIGIGDEEYPASFRCRVGGEGFDVTRSGDVLSIVERGLYGGLESHSQDDTVQVVARFDSVRIHDAAETIIVGALPSLASNVPKDRWDGLAEDFLPRLYSADITEPTAVEDLLAELTVTAPIYFYADVRTNLIELGVIREPASVSTTLTEGTELIAGSVDLKEYPKERVDEVWVYYRIRDAAGDVDDLSNYSQRFILVNPEEQRLRGQRSIKRIYTRWIEAGARDTAEEIAQAYISRFQSQPIRASFDLDAKQGDIWLGNVATIISRQKQTVTGEPRSDLSYQIIQAHEPEPGHAFQYIAQSYEFVSPVDVNNITITILPEDTVDGTGAVDQIDLRELYNSVVAAEIPNITFVVAGGAGLVGGTVVGGGAGQQWSLNLPNDWPWSPDIELRLEPGAVIAGRQGKGGQGSDDNSDSATPGSDGDTGLRVRYVVDVNNLGIIAGGGGGGGGGGRSSDVNDPFVPTYWLIPGGGGGSGAGHGPVAGGQPGDQQDGRTGDGKESGDAGTILAGGDGGAGGSISGATGGRGGRGGDLGQAGFPGADGTATIGTVPAGANPPPGPSSDGAAGGQPGPAVDGVSFITYITRGDIRGEEIN